MLSTSATKSRFSQRKFNKKEVDLYLFKRGEKLFRKSFLKWAGGKSLVLPILKTLLPSGKRLIEPFCGSAVVSLNLNYDSYVLADINADLIELFTYLKKDGLKFVKYCKQFFSSNYNQKDVFLELKNVFNTTGDAKLKSALFLYLNKHCFNGLCRYNSSGEFNVSFGKYVKPYFPEKEMLFFSTFLKQTVLKKTNFLTTMKQAKSGDVVYCDPPYLPLSKTANFVGYGSKGFCLDQHLELVEMARFLQKKGIFVAISNHYSKEIEKIYLKATIHKFKVQRHISCNGNGRKKVEELIAIYGKN